MIISILVLTSVFYFGKKQERKRELPVITREECNFSVQTNDWQSEHIIPRQVFWSKNLNTCLMVTSRPFPGASDWAINYIKEKNLDAYAIIEAENWILWDLNKSNSGGKILERFYQYKNFNEYLGNREKWKEWEADFLQQVQQYR